MSIEELSELENIMRRIEVYVRSGMPQTLVAADMARVLLKMNEVKNKLRLNGLKGTWCCRV